ncbi:MAG: phage tail protein [Candidatus Pelagibacterales bacterium]
MAELVLPSGAIKIIQSQQQLVGGAIAGSAGAVGGVGGNGANPDIDVLKEIKELAFKSFKKTTQIAKTLADSLAFEKNQTRRKNDQSAELSKESGGGGGAVGGFIGPEQPENKKGGLQGIGFALGAAVAPLMNFIGKIGMLFKGLFASKIFSPLAKLFSKGGSFFRFLGPLGPIGLIAGGLFLLFKYSDEIIKALTPAIDKIKKMAQDSAPMIEAFKNGFDWLFKNIIGGIGRVIEGIIDIIGPLITGLGKILTGDIMGGLKDLGQSLLNLVTLPTKLLLEFFDPAIQVIKQIGESILSFFKGIPEMIGTAFTNLISDLKTNFTNNVAAIKSSIMGIFTPISDFFSDLGDRVKTIINSLIEKLPLPDFVKKKLKLETKATQELGETVNETGVKNKYADASVNPMSRDRAYDGGATMNEAFAESKGEKYGKASIKKSGTSGYDSASGIMTPAEFSEYNKLDTNGQMDYLKSLDSNEQERRRMIDKLSKDKLEFDKKNKDYIAKYKTAPDEMVSPDDQMLRDDKIQRQTKDQAKGLVSDNKSGNQTVIVNNSPTNITSQNDVKKADMYSGSISTSSGDNYFDKSVEGYSA